MSLNASQLGQEIASAMQESLAAQWPSVATFATSEAVMLGTRLAQIEELIASQKIDADTASDLLDMQRRAANDVLFSLAGMSIIIAEEAINAGLAVVASAVNAAIGFPLL